jgi:hypothetical protein
MKISWNMLLLLLLTGCHLLDSGAIDQSCEDVATGCGGTDDSGFEIDETDPDGDGFEGADDCNDTDGSIYPGAPEYCDGVDSDCGGDDDAGMVTVQNENFSGIQDAIDAASEGDTINICGGTWTGNLEISKSVTLLGLYGAGDTVISADREASVVYIMDGAVELRGLTLTGGSGSDWVYGSNTYLAGGAVQLQGGSLELKDMILLGNSAELGGGLFVDAGVSETRIENTYIQENSARTHGGGVYSFSDLALVQSEIHANASASAAGGVFLESSRLLLESSSIHSNTSDEYAGGIFARDSSLVCSSKSTIRGNSAGELAGGIYLQGGSVDGCVVELNAAEYGGGILLYESDQAQFDNLLVVGNTALHGGGMFVYDVEVKMDAFTFESNTAQIGGGLVIFGEEADLVLSDGQFNSNQADEVGGGIYFDAGLLEGNAIDFGTNDQANSPDDIGLSGGLFGDGSYDGLGEDTSFTCQSFNGSGLCQF